MTYEEQAKLWAEELECGENKVIVSEGNVLTIVVKEEKHRVENIKSNNDISIILKYHEDTDSLLINIGPEQNKIDGGVLGVVNLELDEIVNTLINITNGKGRIEFFAVSEDLETISIKQILSGPQGKELLKKELVNSGHIQ